MPRKKAFKKQLKEKTGEFIVTFIDSSIKSRYRRFMVEMILFGLIYTALDWLGGIINMGLVKWFILALIAFIALGELYEKVKKIDLNNKTTTTT